MGEAERGAGLHGREDLLVQLGLGGVADEQHDEVGLLDGVEHLTERVVVLREADGARGLEAGGALAQADLDLDVRALQRVAQVLRLRRRLRAPADDTDLLDALERLREQREEVAPSADDLLLRAGEHQLLRLEDLRLDRAGVHCQARAAGGPLALRQRAQRGAAGNEGGEQQAAVQHCVLRSRRSDGDCWRRRSAAHVPPTIMETSTARLSEGATPLTWGARRVS